MIPAYPNTSQVVCVLCLFIAVVVGAFRHRSIYLWNRTEIVELAAGGGNKTEELPLGPYVPAWKSRQGRRTAWTGRIAEGWPPVGVRP